MDELKKSSSTIVNFRKKGGDLLNIPGTRISIQNAQLLTSTGSSTLDFFIGGGLPVGSICLIEEDHYNTYSTLLLKYFLAEGVTNNHSLLVTSGDKEAEKILKELPAAKTVETSTDLKTDDSEHDDLKIAWRYKDKLINDSKIESFNHGFDLSKAMPEDIVKQCHIETWDPSEYEGTNEPYSQQNFVEKPYSDFLQKIENIISSQGYKTASKNCKNILRIGLCSIGSPLWHCCSSTNQKLSLIRFFYILKSILRTSFAVAFITVPSFLLHDTVLIKKLRQTSDIVIGLESFIGSDKQINPLFKDFDGLLHVIKLPVLNSFMYQHPASDLVFKLKKRGFIIEHLHLPPDFGEPPPGQQVVSNCSGTSAKYDF